MDKWGDLGSLRAATEGLIDATKARVSTINRVERGGVADLVLGKEMTANAHAHEKACQGILLQAYEAAVPEKVRKWAQGVPGLGSGILFPKLAGLIGNPRIATPFRWEGSDLIPDGDPYERSLRQLWQYAGCGDPERVPKKNMTREELLACGKRRQVRPILYTFSSYLQRSHGRSPAVAGSRYWEMFEKAKEAGLTKRHERQCQNRNRPPMGSNGCGTSAHPEWGEPGSMWRPGHAQAHAHRIVAKELLRDFWIVSE